ncbi:MAG TPA: acyltransferase [Methylomirabilota bacterium]|jgi:peptidoglycan/LPS O-acetylase OafA/YrhL
MSSSGRTHLDSLDGVRGVAVLTVMLYHARIASFRGGFLGVDIFFVLSGFLITGLLLREWEGTGSVNLRRFYLRRALRLLPALLALLLLALAFPRVFTPRLEDGQSPRLWLAALASISYASNWVRAFDLTDMSFLQHTWSLGIEEQFYTLWPLGLLFLLKARNRRLTCVSVVCAGIVGSAVLRAVRWQGRASLLRDYYSLETRLDSLLIGCLLALLLSWGLIPRTGRWIAMIRAAAIASVVALALMIHRAEYTGPATYHWLLFVAALCVGIVLLHLVHSPSRAVEAVLTLPALVWLGRISYGVYLWHSPIQTGVLGEARMLRLGLTGPLRIAIPFVVTIAVAAVSFYLLERPILRTNTKRREQTDAAQTLRRTWLQ